MAYYADLSTYQYIKEKSKSNVFNVGWLDNDHSFKMGKSNSSVLKKLFDLCKKTVNKTRGYHLCPFCPEPSFGVPVEIDEEKVVLGSAEIWIKSEDGKIYAAPDLIYHYMRDHNYLPPEEFFITIEKGEVVNPEDI